MSKQIDVELSASSVSKAIKELELIKQKLATRNDEFVDELSDMAERSVNATLATVNSREIQHPLNVNRRVIGNSKNQKEVKISIKGKEALIVEFGAGINLGMPPGSHPLAGYGYGTFPGQKRALSRGGWWYKDENGKHHTYGTSYYTPILNADELVKQNYKQVAKEVFGKW